MRAFVDDAILICQHCGLPYAVKHWEVRSELIGKPTRATCPGACRFRRGKFEPHVRCACGCGDLIPVAAIRHRGRNRRHFKDGDHFRRWQAARRVTLTCSCGCGAEFTLPTNAVVGHKDHFLNQRHYFEWRSRTGQFVGQTHGNYKGRGVDGSGHVWINKAELTAGELAVVWPMFDSKGRVHEHRVVMALHLGRPLLRSEHVHHNHDPELGPIAKDKTDNRIEVLYLEDNSSHGKKTNDMLAEMRRMERYIARLEAMLAEREAVPA